MNALYFGFLVEVLVYGDGGVIEQKSHFEKGYSNSAYGSESWGMWCNVLSAATYSSLKSAANIPAVLSHCISEELQSLSTLATNYHLIPARDWQNYPETTHPKQKLSQGMHLSSATESSTCCPAYF